MENDSKKYLKFIKSRRSIRNFIHSKIQRDTILEILECGRLSPSGKNNQPWRLNVVTHPSVKKMLAELTTSGDIIESAYLNFVIFLDLEKVYDRVKDIQSMGAFMENILLGIHAMNLGGVWLGEILKNKEEVNEIFKLSSAKYELMGVIAVGEIDKEIIKLKGESLRERRPLDDFIEWY